MGEGGRTRSRKRWAAYVVGGVLALFLLIQAVPYGRAHSDPPVTKEPAWDSSQTRALAKEACFDCHSNETKWPWYTNIAPTSWLVENDVNGGRSTLNFSEWDKPQNVGDIVEAVQGGGMPPWYYKLMPNHSKARLSGADKAALIAGLQKTIQASPPPAGGG
jgi:mono/diheme cytochrome c family protein